MGSDRSVIFLGALLVSSFVLIRAGGNNRHRHNNDDEFSTPDECHRECRVGEPPKICYYHFTLEYYTVLGPACELCTPNNTNILSNTCQCVPGDGVERTIMTINRKLPGPSIQVCLGDKIIVDVANYIDGTGITIHWHGILQRGSQYYDGVPFVTQCPIPFGNTFRYQFDADNEGTHFYHSHAGFAKMDGILGSLIVRIPRENEPNGKLYDYDSPYHIAMLMDWTHGLTAERFPGLLRRNAYQNPDSLLINGRGDYQSRVTGEWTNASLAVFHIRSGYAYRFRFMNGFCSTCIGELAIQGHRMTLIATDGVPVRPVEVDTVNSLAGERFDVIINANRRPGCYYMVLRGIGTCAGGKVIQYALLCYEDGYHRPVSKRPTYDSPLPQGVVLGPLDGMCNTTRNHSICISQLRSARPVDKGMLHERADHTFFFDVDFLIYNLRQLFKAGNYPRFSIPTGNISMRSRVNNISFVFPPSPPLSQPHDIPFNQYCDKDYRPTCCEEPCACTQMYNITMGSIVEMVLTDGAGRQPLAHPIHMHGYAFTVMGMGVYPDRRVKRMRAHHARYLANRNQLCKNFYQPPYKDTVTIPTGGYAVIRFRADNPGYWLMHCHLLFHQLVGMEILLRVGDRDDLPPIPKGFPKCGNFLPPIGSDNSSPRKYPY